MSRVDIYRKALQLEASNNALHGANEALTRRADAAESALAALKLEHEHEKGRASLFAQAASDSDRALATLRAGVEKHLRGATGAFNAAYNEGLIEGGRPDETGVTAEQYRDSHERWLRDAFALLGGGR